MNSDPPFHLSKLAEMVRPLGAPATVTTIIAVAALSALSLGAPTIAVCVIAFLSFGAYIFAEERKAFLSEKLAKAEFDRARITQTKEPAQRLKRRLQKRKEQKQIPAQDEE